MTATPSSDEARLALQAVEAGRRSVLDQVDLPTWYWAGLAVGWVVLGVVNDSGHEVVSTIATVLFGAVNASVASRVADGRHGSGRLTVRHGVVTRHLPMLVVGFLVLMGVLTVVGALLVRADGADHPVTITSVGIAGVVLFGGPQLLAAVRRRELRRTTTA